MKYIMLFLLLAALSGCSKFTPKDKRSVYELLSCNRNSCILLTRFEDYRSCLNLVNSLADLHKNILKDEPSVILFCHEEVR